MSQAAAKLRLVGRQEVVPLLVIEEAEERRHPLLWLFAGFVALLGHVLILGLLGSLAGLAPEPPQEPLAFEVVEIAKPEPPPEPEPEPPPEEPPPVVDMSVAKVDPDPQPIPPPQDAPAPPEDAPKPVFGVTMASTVGSGGSFQVQVGNTVRADPNAPRPDEDQPEGPPAVRYQSIEKEPRVMREVKAEYPPDAKEEGIEGLVILKLTINEEGRVTDAKVVKGPDPRLNEAARQALLQFLFSPGEMGGRSVITTNYVYRYLWVIDE